MSLDLGNIDSTGLHEKGVGEIDEGNKFQYKPLDSSSKCIRLLEVLSEHNTSTIKCDLREVSLDDDPAYIALSYTWDREKKAKEIEVKGKLLTIGQNLWHFLHQYLRASESTRSLLWIDALCIDQSNIRERNHQVNQMREIYAGADSVIVWLGNEVDDTTTQLAFDLVVGPNRLQLRNGHDPRQHRSKKQWKALQTLFDEPYYWSRVWIIQEFILAKSVEVWCGNRSAQLEYFEQLCRCIQRFERPSMPQHAASGRVLESRGWTLSKHRSQWLRAGKAGTKTSAFGLQQLLQTYAHSQSTDIRDRVYALLGIVCDTSQSQHPIVVDYAKSNVEVLVDVARNQCQWSSLSEAAASYKFVSSLCELLEVSSAALIFHVIRYVPGLQGHINILNTRAHVHVPLRSIGVIVDVGCLYNPDEEIPNRLILNWPLKWRHDRSHSVQSKSVSVQWIHNVDDTDTGRLPDTDVSALYADESGPPQSTADALELSTTSMIPASYCNTELVTFDDNRWHYEVQNTSRNHVTFGSKDRRPGMTEKMRSMGKLNVFVCTENLIGITSSPARIGDVICVPSDNTSLESAIIMRRSADVWRWTAVGLAIIPHKSDVFRDDPMALPPYINAESISELPETDRADILENTEIAREPPHQNSLLPISLQERQMSELIGEREFSSDNPHIYRYEERGFVISQELEGEHLTWRVRPSKGCRFSPRGREPVKSKWLRLFCPPTCLPQLARVGLLHQALVPKYSGFKLFQEGREGGAIGVDSDKKSGDGREKDSGMDRRAGCDGLDTSPHHDNPDESSVAVSMGSIPLPTFTKKGNSSSGRSGLILPKSRPDWRISDPERRFDE